MATSGQASRSDLVATLIVNAADGPKMIDPPVKAFVASPRPVLILPGELRVYVDEASTHTDAADWWRRLAVLALYAGDWHEAHAGENN